MKELSPEENSRYFSRWNQDYLAFHLKAVQDLLRAREKARRTSHLPMTLGFKDLYHAERLKITGADVRVNQSSIYLKPTSKSCRAELILPTSISMLSYDVVNIFASFHPVPEDSFSPFQNYVRLFWKSEGQREYSGEKSLPLDLYDLKNKPHIEADLSANILWLQGKNLKATLLVFHFSRDSDIELHKIEFLSSLTDATMKEKAQEASGQ